MKHLLAIVLLLTCAVTGYGQPVQRNFFSTNTAPVPTDISMLLQPTRIGTAQASVVWEGHARTNGYCFYLPAGSQGIIRSIAYQTTDSFAAGWTRRNQILFRVFCDKGNISNTTPDTNYMTVQVPIGTLATDAFRFTSNGAYACRRSTALIDVFSGWNDQNTNTTHFLLKTPMQFTNGIAIGLWDADGAAGGIPYTNGYFVVDYEIGTLNPLLANYRTYIRHSTTNSTASSNSATIRLFGVTGKTGLVVGWAESWSWILSPADLDSGLTQSANESFSAMGEIPIIFETGGTAFGYNPMEAGWKATYYSWSGSAWMSTGKDDLFQNSFAFTNARQWDGAYIGTPHRVLEGFDDTRQEGALPGWAIAKQESYRWFVQDSFSFAGSLLVTAPHVPITTNMLYRAMLITYERP